MKNNKGARNLVILGVSATLIAFLTTFVALKFYQGTGDIYLDRSRPGYLPEKKEEEDEEKFQFQDTGEVTKEVLKDYLEHFKKELKEDEYFKSGALSSEALGISE